MLVECEVVVDGLRDGSNLHSSLLTANEEGGSVECHFLSSRV